jgi:hypothetical protein
MKYYLIRKDIFYWCRYGLTLNQDEALIFESIHSAQVEIKYRIKTEDIISIEPVVKRYWIYILDRNSNIRWYNEKILGFIEIPTQYTSAEECLEQLNYLRFIGFNCNYTIKYVNTKE